MTNNENNFEFDLLEFYKNLLINKKVIIKSVLIFILLGVIYSTQLPNIYKSDLIMIPQSKSKMTNNSIKGLAGIAGINIDNFSNEKFNISPDIYPEIIQDPDIKIKILNSKLDSALSLRDYLEKKEIKILDLVKEYTIKLPFKVLALFYKSSTNNDKYLNNNSIYISKEEYQLFKILNDIINIDLNPSKGYVIISARLENSTYSTILVNNVKNIIQESIILYETQYYRKILNSTLNVYNMKKNEFEIIQNKLSEFKDKNQKISSSIFSNELFKLQNEFDLKKMIFQNIALQLEESKIKLEEVTPIFTIIKNPKIPIDKDSPNRSLIVIFYAIIGFLISLIIINKEKLTFLKL